MIGVMITRTNSSGVHTDDISEGTDHACIFNYAKHSNYVHINVLNMLTPLIRFNTTLFIIYILIILNAVLSCVTVTTESIY